VAIVVHLGFEPLKQRSDALELHAFDAAIPRVLVVVWRARMVREVVVPEDGVAIELAESTVIIPSS
jgi:hypothetical protein